MLMKNPRIQFFLASCSSQLEAFHRLFSQKCSSVSYVFLFITYLLFDMDVYL